MSVPASHPDFMFVHAGSDKFHAWPRYKLKECWTLVLCLLLLRGCKGSVVVHNWWSNSSLKFTREFRDRRAAQTDPMLVDANIIEPHAAALPVRIFALGLAALMMLIPVGGLMLLTRLLCPRRLTALVVYADGHLAGNALVRAAQSRGCRTFSLHHGLYRSDDSGSIMGIRNFVADHMCLWDTRTRQVFIEAGTDPVRLALVGEYGFGDLSSEAPQDPKLIVLCPPYDVRCMGTFKAIEAVLSKDYETRWSLHPMLRADHQDLVQSAVAEVTPRPAVVVSGDSGVLMDALSRAIPMLTVSDRPLGAAHLTMAEAEQITPDALAILLKKAQDSLDADRQTFGFDSRADRSSEEAMQWS